MNHVVFFLAALFEGEVIWAGAKLMIVPNIWWEDIKSIWWDRYIFLRSLGRDFEPSGPPKKSCMPVWSCAMQKKVVQRIENSGGWICFERLSLKSATEY